MKKEQLILHCVTKLLPCLLYTGSWQRRSVSIGSDDFRLNYLLHDGLGKTLKLARNTALPRRRAPRQFPKVGQGRNAKSPLTGQEGIENQ